MIAKNTKAPSAWPRNGACIGFAVERIVKPSREALAGRPA